MMCSTLLVGCCKDEEYTLIEEDSNLETYLTIHISTLDEATTTRNNPNGGNEGDGRILGINNENKIYNLTLFLYETDAADGINTTSNPLIRSFYVNESNIENLSAYSYRTKPIAIPKMSVIANTRILIIANAGDWTGKGINTLSDLKNCVYYEAATTVHSNMAEYDRFVMTSTLSSTFKLEENGEKLGSYSKPVTASTTIERLSARIDIVPNATLQSGGYYEYQVGETGNKVRISHITAFNCWNSKGGEYLLKRVSSDGTNSNIKYLGKETPDSGIQTNYVIDPYTTTKNVAYWNDNSATVLTWYRNHITTSPTNKTVSDAIYTDGSEKFYILDYTQENTMLKENQLNCYATGIIAQASFIPSVVYQADGSTASYVANSDLWYRNGRFYNYAYPNATLYSKGVCYYRYYIRHSNDNEVGKMAVMEFAIVRNNIYRLTINSFSGIGYTDPTPSDPTDMDENMKIILYVEPWTVVQHTTIII